MEVVCSFLQMMQMTEQLTCGHASPMRCKGNIALKLIYVFQLYTNLIGLESVGIDLKAYWSWV